jgi:hypothetical protein
MAHYILGFWTTTIYRQIYQQFRAKERNFQADGRRVLRSTNVPRMTVSADRFV